MVQYEFMQDSAILKVQRLQLNLQEIRLLFFSSSGRTAAANVVIFIHNIIYGGI